MTREAATTNKVIWDSSLRIQMQSTNGLLSRTCGLARNILFTLRGVTVLLQVHVIEETPYMVLLGWPFDLIMANKVINNQEGN